MPKYKEIRQEKGLQARQVAEQAGVDPTLYSKIENYRVLPIPAEFEKLLAALGCLPADVYDPEEVTLLPSTSKVETVGGARVHCEPTEYKMTVRLGNECREVLTKAVLQKCGYKSIGDWVNACIRRLKSQHEIILKAEKRPHQSKKTNGAVEARHTTDNSPTTISLTNQNENVKEAYHNNERL